MFTQGQGAWGDGHIAVTFTPCLTSPQNSTKGRKYSSTSEQSHQHCVITGGPRLTVPCSTSQKQGSLSRGDESCHTVTCSKGPALHKDRELLPSPGGQAGHVPALMSKHLLEMLEKGSFFSAQPAQGNPPRSTGGAGCRNCMDHFTLDSSFGPPSSPGGTASLPPRLSSPNSLLLGPATLPGSRTGSPLPDVSASSPYVQQERKQPLWHSHLLFQGF